MSTIAMNTIGNEIIRDIRGTIGTTAFVKTFADACRKVCNNKVFTIKQWNILEEMYRDHPQEQEAILDELGINNMMFIKEPLYDGSDGIYIMSQYKRGEIKAKHGCFRTMDKFVVD